MSILTEEEKIEILERANRNLLLDLIEDVESAVLEKLKQQGPVGEVIRQFSCGNFGGITVRFLTTDVPHGTRLYAAPVPAAVPDGLIEKIKEYGAAKMAWGIGYGMDVPPKDEGPEILAQIEAMLSSAPAVQKGGE